MNKKALYETIMRQVSKEVKKALNEKDDSILKANLVDMIIEMAQQSEYDISELEMMNGSFWNGEGDVECYIQTIDSEGLHSCPEWDIENLDCYTPDPFSELMNFSLEDIETIYNYMRECE